MKTNLVVGTLVAVVSMAAVACGKPKIDNAKLEEAIKTGIHSQVKDASIKSMTCPADVEAKVGGTFECKGQDADGTALTIAVTIKDEQGNVEWKLANAAAPAASSAK